MADLLVVGSHVSMSATFSVAGVPTDPTTVTLTVRAPDGTTTTPVPAHPSTGVYSHVEQASQVGVWAYRFEGTGAAAGVSEGTFDIVPSKALTGVPGYTYDLATDVGKVRLYIDDHDFSVVDAQTPAEQRSALFDDAEVAVFIASGSAYKGASRALTAMANSRSLLVRVRRIGDTTVDYGDLRADLLKAAKAYDDLADESDDGTTSPADGYAEVAWTEFAARQIVVGAAIRAEP